MLDFVDISIRDITSLLWGILTLASLRQRFDVRFITSLLNGILTRYAPEV